MPVAVAIFIRGLIQAIVSTGIIVAGENILLKLLDKAESALQTENDMTTEEAQDTIANEIIDTLLLLGLLTFSIRSKIPARIAERLGFTSKGWSKRPISSKVKPGTAGSVKATVSASAGAKILTQTEANTIIEAAKTNVRGFKKALSFLEGRLNSIFLAFLVFGNFLDFGNWETGAYSDTFQKIFAFVTFGLLQPNEDYRKTKTASPEVFQKVYDTYKIAGVTGIADPYKLQSVAFTRDNLMDVVDQVGAQLLLSTGEASTKQVLEATTMLVIFPEDAGKNIPTYTTPQTYVSKPSSATPVTTPRVYTGIVSQGVVGKPTSFETRPDDLIESKDELLQAAANNLTPYLTHLLSKVVYEVKIVSSIITKDGFKQTGTLQQVQNGTYANGKPKYKTVSNKFAVLDVFVITDRGTRSRVTSIVLGPTNSAKLVLPLNELRSIEASLPGMVTTTDINAITGIETSAPITVSTPTSTTAAAASVAATAQSEKTATEAHTPPPIALATGDAATTLSEWYRLQGQQLPSVSTRSQLYERFGLGLAAYYTGTAEQNTKLLAALKQQATQTPTPTTSGTSTSGSSSTSKSGSSSTSTSDVPPRVGKADSTGKVVQSWVRLSSGSYVVTYKDGSKRTIKP